MKASADPDEVFIDSLSNVYIDVANKDTKALESVDIDVFDAGLMTKEGSCQTLLPSMAPNQSMTLRCILKAPIEITEDVAENKIHARAQYKATLSMLQEVDFITPEWNERQRLTGPQPRQEKSVYADRNIEAAVEFSDPMPFIARDGKKYYMYITVRNVGNGALTELKDTKLEFIDEKKITECTPETLYIVGKKFPRIACEITPPALKDQATVGLILKIGYNYDIRTSTMIKIKK